jgi:hypothetical protein
VVGSSDAAARTNGTYAGRLVGSWQWLWSILQVIGCLAILGQLFWLFAVLPVKLFLRLFGFMVRLLRVNA